MNVDPQQVIEKMRQITIERPLYQKSDIDVRYVWIERWDDLVDWLAGIRDGVGQCEKK